MTKNNNIANDSERAELNEKMDRLIELIERAVPAEIQKFNAKQANTFLWIAEQKYLKPINNTQNIEINLLKGIENQKQILMQNTTQFAKGASANNALLWGARGMGKSSLIKTIHNEINKKNRKTELKLIEILKEDIHSLITLCDVIRDEKYQFIIFCDDLSFEENDAGYKALKASLEGGVSGQANNCIFYATSNRRHLMPRKAMENEQKAAINSNEEIEEKVSLSDRFGLWIGFHKCNQDEYLEMVESYFNFYGLGTIDELPKIKKEALEWSVTRGNRSGRIAFQYVTDLAGKKGLKIT